MFNGKGGYSWETVYHMPIWLRNFTFTKLKDFYEKQNEDSQQPTKSDNVFKGPNIQPYYSTKASK